MKQSKKAAAIAVAILLISMTFAACGSSADDPVVGEWEMSSLIVSGQELSAADFLKQANVEETPLLVFKSDQTVELNMLGKEGKGKWKAKDGKYTVTDDTDTTLELTLEDDKLSASQSGATLVFVKKAR